MIKLVGTCPTAPPLLPGWSRDQKCPSPSHAQPLRRALGPNSMGGKATVRGTSRAAENLGQGVRMRFLFPARCSRGMALPAPTLRQQLCGSPPPHPRGGRRDRNIPKCPHLARHWGNLPFTPRTPLGAAPPSQKGLTFSSQSGVQLACASKKPGSWGEAANNSPTSPHLGEPLLLLPPQRKTGASRFAAWEFI